MCALFVVKLSAFFLSEPSIECTVIKVLKTSSIFGLKDYPSKYSTINNHSASSELKLDGRLFYNLSPVVKNQNESYQEIVIENSIDKMVLKIHGKPISRSGVLEINGIQVASITCH